MENVTQDKQVIKMTEQLMDKTRQPYATMVELAVVLGERETDDALDGVDSDALAGLQRDLIEPLLAPRRLQRAAAQGRCCPHAARRHGPAPRAPRHDVAEAHQDRGVPAAPGVLQQREGPLRGEIIVETATLGQEHETVRRLS